MKCNLKKKQCTVEGWFTNDMRQLSKGLKQPRNDIDQLSLDIEHGAKGLRLGSNIIYQLTNVLWQQEKEKMKPVKHKR